MTKPLKHILKSATDPLKSGPNAGQELAKRFGRAADGFSNDDAVNAAVSVLLTVIRQTNPNGHKAHAKLSEYADKMHAILDQHYDAVTGRRRSIFAFDQTIYMNFIDDRNRKD